jgi:hypothetical protein
VQQSPTVSREAQHLLAIGFRISRLGRMLHRLRRFGTFGKAERKDPDKIATAL